MIYNTDQPRSSPETNKVIPMMQAHRVICPVHGRQLRIDLPPDFPSEGEAEVIILPVRKDLSLAAEPHPGEWLQRVWGCSPDFPDRLPDSPPEPVEPL